MQRLGPQEFPSSERFEILECLGRGGMGAVFRAYDRETQAEVAIKVLERRGTSSLLRFKNEFRAVQDIRHPNLVELGELGQIADTWFFTMELVEDATDFLGHVRRVADGPGQRRFDERRLRDALIQLGRALVVLHRAHKVHRDIKPSNILLSSGRLVLLDFGLVLDADNPERITAADVVVGTGAYMAPEQTRPGEPVDAPADCYAVGTLLYEALTGRLPFSGSPTEIVMAKRAVMPPRPSALAPEVPAELDQLCIELLDLDPSARPSAREVVLRLGGTLDATTTDSGVLTPPLLGRDRELARIEALLATRAAQVVMVRGPSGVGKTSLVRTATARLEATHDATVLSGRCFERESVPFKGLEGVVDGLARIVKTMHPARARTLLGAGAGLLAPVFPALRRLDLVRRRVDGLGTLDRQEIRRRAVDALREVLASLAGERALVIAIDDIQWARADTWSVIQQLTHPPDAPPVLWILTERAQEDATTRQKLAVTPTEIALGPLADDDARALARWLLDHSSLAPGAGVADEIAREADGHPLFIQELVSHAAAAGLPRAARLDQALQERFGRLSAPARHVLELVGAAGLPTPNGTIAEAAELSLAAYGRAVAELRIARLVRTTGGRAADTIEHYHDRVREACLAALDAEALRALHSRLGQALETSGLSQREPELVVHHLVAGGDHARAAFYAEAAARRASDAFAFDRAASLYQTALELGDLDQHRRLALLLARAESLVHAGRGRDAAALYLEAAASGDAASRLDCRRRAAEQLLISGHLERGTEVLAQVLADIGESLPRSPRRALWSLLGQRARLRLRGLGWKSRDVSEIAPRALMRLEVYWSVACGLAIVDSIRAAAYQARHLRAALALGEPSRVARALAVEAGFLAGQGALARAEELARRAREIADGSDSAHAQAIARLADGSIDYFCRNAWRAAVAKMTEAETIYQERAQASGWEAATSQLYVCFCLMYLGELDALTRRVPALVADARRRGDRYAEVNLRSRLHLVWLARDEPERAASEITEAMAAWVPPSDTFQVQHFFAMMGRVETSLYRGDVSAAAATLDASLPGLHASQLMRVQIVRCEVVDLQARVALAAGDVQTARTHARALARLPLPMATPLTETLWAQMAEGEARGRHWANAIAGFDELEMALHAAVARARAGDSGGEHWLARHAAVPARMIRLFAPGR